MSKKVTATILFVDIMDSMELANYWSDKRYNDFLNEFQWMMLTQIELEGKRGITDVKIVGDELAVFYSSKDVTADILRAIDFANELKVRWYTSDTNLKRVKEGKKIIDLGVGINTGSVILDQRPFRKKLGNLVCRRKTFEGLAISVARGSKGYPEKGIIQELWSVIEQWRSWVNFTTTTNSSSWACTSSRVCHNQYLSLS